MDLSSISFKLMHSNWFFQNSFLRKSCENPHESTVTFHTFHLLISFGVFIPTFGAPDPTRSHRRSWNTTSSSAPVVPTSRTRRWGSCAGDAELQRKDASLAPVDLKKASKFKGTRVPSRFNRIWLPVYIYIYIVYLYVCVVYFPFFSRKYGCKCSNYFHFLAFSIAMLEYGLTGFTKHKNAVFVSLPIHWCLASCWLLVVFVHWPGKTACFLARKICKRFTVGR